MLFTLSGPTRVFSSLFCSSRAFFFFFCFLMVGMLVFSSQTSVPVNFNVQNGLKGKIKRGR